MKKISFVIPCYGSEKTIEFVVNEIVETVSQKKDEYDYEIIAIHDCSPDNVLSVLKRLAQDNKRLKIIDFAKNFGKHAGVLAGFNYASGDYIVGLDDDGQCPMDHLWELLAPLINDESDYAMAKYSHVKQSAFKNFGSAVNSVMSKVLINKPKDLYFSNFYAMKSFVAKEMTKYNNPYPYLEGLTLRTTRSIITVPMEERERIEGQGNFTFRKSLSLWLNGFTAFSVKPLRIATVIGTLCAFFGFIFGLYVIIKKIVNPDIAMGYSSTMAVILFIGGVIMLMLGMIGEYIGRIYISINNSPQYVVRDIINDDTSREK
ncbi:MAG: glycosyltransferase [Eubacterium sp.]